jgi:alkylation response protein AidB-like acyl-CoA dehydrogenase
MIRRRILPDAHAMLQKVAREFAEKEVAPLAAELDLTGEFPREQVL